MAQDDDSSGGKKTATLMGTGATAGAAVGGPAGALIGGVTGGLIGYAMEDDDENK